MISIGEVIGKVTVLPFAKDTVYFTPERFKIIFLTGELTGVVIPFGRPDGSC